MLTFRPYPVCQHAHCFGWDYLIHKLYQNLALGEGGIVLDDFVETYFWEIDKKPHSSPWIGILHYTPTAPTHLGGKTLEDLLKLEKFQESLKWCKLLVVLCHTTREFLLDKIAIPIKVVHMAKEAICNFSLDAYLENPTMFHAGHYLRSYAKYYYFNTDLKRILNICYPWHLEALSKDLAFHEVCPCDFKQRVAVFNGFLPDSEYVELLRTRLSFCWLYDSGANNAVLESIVSHAPIVVNRISPIVEYLGDDYPLYFDNICHDPDRFLLNQEILSKTILYLKNRSKYFTCDKFVEFFLSIKASDLA